MQHLFKLRKVIPLLEQKIELKILRITEIYKDMCTTFLRHYNSKPNSIQGKVAFCHSGWELLSVRLG